jgi:hypothetical protein
MKNRFPAARACLLAGCLALPSHAFALEILEKAVEDARGAAHNAPVDASERINALNAAIKQGQDAAKELRGRIDELEREKRDLEKVQTALTSGLIGALIAAIVAIAGALGKFWTSKAERDLKRLEVIDKLAGLEARDVAVPVEIRRQYETPR